MGGNVFPGLVRLNKTEYQELIKEVSVKLNGFSGIHFSVIPAYKTKDSFGDLDILYYRKSTDISFEEKDIIDLLNPADISRNGEICSIEYKTKNGPFQIDLIESPENSFNFALNYFAYNDLGNFMGRIAHKMGFKLGHLGLRYVIRGTNGETNVIKEITITNYWMAAMQFLGYERYNSTYFNTLEDIFQFAISSPYVNRDIFQLENRNHEARTRDRKRKTYSLFLEFLKNSKANCAEFDWSDKERLRSDFLEMALDRFPSFRREYDQVLSDHRKHLEIKSKFNGDIVSGLTGLSGKELGRFIKDFKEFYWADPTFESFILNNEQDLINKRISVFQSQL